MRWDWVELGVFPLLCLAVIPVVLFLAAMQTKSITRKSMRVLLGVGVVAVYLALVAVFLFPSVGSPPRGHGASVTSTNSEKSRSRMPKPIRGDSRIRSARSSRKDT